MPISCPLQVKSPSYEEFAELDYRSVMPSAFMTHNTIGPLADESVYQADLAIRLRHGGMNVQRELPLIVSFESYEKRFFVDVLVNKCGIYEIKATKSLTQEHEMQLLNYLFLLDVERGKLINFKTDRVESRFVNSGRTRSDRQSFRIHDNGWTDKTLLRERCVSVLRDWGTGLSLPLYSGALIHLMGGEDQVVRQLEMCRDQATLGRQPFPLCSESSAFHLTALTSGRDRYQDNLQKLLRHSPLNSIHWINISIGTVHFASVLR